MSRRGITGWCLTLCLLAPGAVPEAAAQAPGREVLRRAELDALGVHRLSDLIRWAAGRAATVDGLGWQVSPDGLPADGTPGASPPQWRVLVDGVPVDVAGLGALMPELAPVGVEAIDSVEVIRAPALVGGQLAARGVLHLHTRRPAPGPSLGLGYRNGSETGDPGPYRWTPLATPNVDRDGPDGHAWTGYTARRWHARAGVRYLRTPVTDSLLHHHFRTAWYQPFAYVWGPTLQLGGEGLGGRHRMVLGHVDHDGYAWAPAAGGLQNSQLALTQGGAAGSVAVGRGARVEYQLAHSRLRWVKEPDLLPARAPHLRASTRGAVELLAGGGAWRGRLGLGAVRRDLRAATEAPGEHRQRASIFAGVEHTPGSAWSAQLAGSAGRGSGTWSGAALAAARWSPGPSRALAVSAAAAHLPPDQGTAWTDARALPGPPLPLAGWRLLRADLGWEQRLSSWLRLDAGAAYTHLRQAPPAASPPAAAEASTPVSGGRFGLRGRLALDAPGVHGWVRYDALAPAMATAAWEPAMESLADHLLQALLAYTPAASFRLAASVDHRSGAPWTALPHPPLRPFTRVDLSAEKWFWNRRARAQLAIQNALNQPERHHPLGARWDLRYYVAGSVVVP